MDTQRAAHLGSCAGWQSLQTICFPGCKHTGESHRRGTSPAGFGVGLPLGWGCHPMRNSVGGPSPPNGSTNVCFHHVSIKPPAPKAKRYLRVWQMPNQPENQTQHTKEPPLQPPANGRTARRYSLPEPRRPAVRSGVTPATRPWGRSRGPNSPSGPCGGGACFTPARPRTKRQEEPPTQVPANGMTAWRYSPSLIATMGPSQGTTISQNSRWGLPLFLAVSGSTQQRTLRQHAISKKPGRSTMLPDMGPSSWEPSSERGTHEQEACEVTPCLGTSLEAFLAPFCSLAPFWNLFLG